jgi:predicted enzyme related to lactoylglutathione lyase
MLSRADRPEFDHPASILYYTVDDIEQAYAALVARDVASQAGPELTHRQPGSELWLAFVRDSEGNLLGLMEERAV